jgi:hypothetical protein
MNYDALYRFDTLDPRNPVRVPEAAEANNRVFARGPVYGIEVTIPALADRCFGNLDPQHTDGLNVSACKAALTCQLPAFGATLATNRLDADSLAAMAVLWCRAAGNQIDVEIIDAIDSGDCAPRGPWVRDYQPHWMFADMSAMANDRSLTITDKVMRIADVLIGTGDPLPTAVPADLSGLDVDTAYSGFVVIYDRKGDGRGANGLGYQHAPVVITCNPRFRYNGGQPHLKFGVARWNDRYPMCWNDMIAEFRTIEPGWGGTSSIIGSTQGEASTMTLDQVIEIVKRHIVA